MFPQCCVKMKVRHFSQVAALLKHAPSRQLLKAPHTRGLCVSVGFLNSEGGGADKILVRDAETFFQNLLNEHDTGLMFAGTGQCMLKDNSRLILINFGENFLRDESTIFLNPNHLLDIGFHPNNRMKLNESISAGTNLHVYSGVLDFVNSSHWKYGFTLNPYSIFSQDERVCFLKGKDLYVSVRGRQQVLDVDDVDHVGVWVSRFPHNQRRLVLGLKNHVRRERDRLIIVDIISNDTSGDLFRLAVDTEWLLKAAALLCVKMKRQGNKDLYMKVSAPLQPKNNIWVAIQRKKWMKMVKKNSRNWTEGDDF